MVSARFRDNGLQHKGDAPGQLQLISIKDVFQARPTFFRENTKDLH
jgi:hypothetical protein